jgi:mono/diheme cytochrome c family protein
VPVVGSVTLTSSVKNDAVALKWTIPGKGKYTYTVLMNGSSVGTTNGKSYKSKAMANGTYSYEVDAKDATGATVAQSNVVSATVNYVPKPKKTPKPKPTPAPTPTPTPTPTPVPGTIDGAALYNSNCSGCHGALASSSKKGRSASQIQSAINGVGSMSGLKSLTSAQVAAIATALSGATPTPTPAPTIIDGASLYTSTCSSCHGPLSKSSVMGKSATDIKSAISANRGGMGSLKLTDAQITAIGKTLTSGFTLPDCATCHNANGSLKSGSDGGGD